MALGIYYIAQVIRLYGLHVSEAVTINTLVKKYLTQLEKVKKRVAPEVAVLSACHSEQIYLKDAV